jgi:hypothetical protein
VQPPLPSVPSEQLVHAVWASLPDGTVLLQAATALSANVIKHIIEPILLILLLFIVISFLFGAVLFRGSIHRLPRVLGGSKSEPFFYKKIPLPYLTEWFGLNLCSIARCGHKSFFLAS